MYDLYRKTKQESLPGKYNRVGIPDSGVIDSTSDVDTGSNEWTVGETFYRSIWQLLPNLGKATPIRFKVVDGVLPTTTPQVEEGTTYYIARANNATFEVSMYTTEGEAVLQTGRIAITATTTGTFKLTQEGVSLEDAFQGHLHPKDISTAPGSESTFAQGGPFAGPSDENYEEEPIAFEGNGDPRSINETRPVTNILFAYMKAEHVTSSGEPVSALIWKSGWISNDSWTNAYLVHDTDLDFEDGSDLHIELWFKDPANPSRITKPYTLNKHNTDGALGIRVYPELNRVMLSSYSTGFYITSPISSNPLLLTTQTYEYNLVVSKPNLINTVFDVGNISPTYELTSANVIKTLPEINGVSQILTWYWENGDGTYKVTPSVTDGATINGRPAADWIGEGKGHMTVESDGVSNWRVREYEDSYEGSNEYWRKYTNGTKEYFYEDTTIRVTNVVNGNVFGVNLNYVYGTLFTSIRSVIPSARFGNRRVWGAGPNNITNLGFEYLLMGTTIAASGYPSYTVIGGWL